MRRGGKRHPELANEEKNLNKLTSTPHFLKSQHRKLRKGLGRGQTVPSGGLCPFLCLLNPRGHPKLKDVSQNRWPKVLCAWWGGKYGVSLGVAAPCSPIYALYPILAGSSDANIYISSLLCLKRWQFAHGYGCLTSLWVDIGGTTLLYGVASNETDSWRQGSFTLNQVYLKASVLKALTPLFKG